MFSPNFEDVEKFQAIKGFGIQLFYDRRCQQSQVAVYQK